MKIAFCLFGIVGGLRKYGLGGLADFGMCAANYKKMIFADNDVDVFIHTWSYKQEKPLKRTYNPTMAIYEPQKLFYIPPDLHDKAKKDRFVECSRWYSTREVIGLQHDYSMRNKIDYDFIMLSRFDMLWTVPVDFKSLKKDTLYLSNWNDYGYFIGDKVTKSNHSHPYGQKMRKYQDLWIIGNQEHMLHISKIFEMVDKSKAAKYSPHGILFNHLYPVYGNNIEFIYYYGIDYHLYRRMVAKHWM